MSPKKTPFTLHSNADLTHYNTFKLPVNAHAFVEIHSFDQLVALYHHPAWKTEKKLFLGSGSNILFANTHFPGLVVKVNIPGITCIKEDDEHAWIQAGSGVNWHSLVQYCIKQGYSGIENLSYIPGTAGAAPIQNIGAYGVELKDTFETLEAFHLIEGKRVVFNKDACEFGYRHSVFKERLKNQYMICSITLKLNKKHSFNIQYGDIQKTLTEFGITEPKPHTISEAITHIRKNKLPDPSHFPNVGSFFKNPYIPIEQFNQLKAVYADIPHYPIDETQVKIPAGWLIEKVGWKGKTHQHVGTYHKQALVIINHEGKGSGQSIIEFSNQLKQEVLHVFGITLAPEVTIIK